MNNELINALEWLKVNGNTYYRSGAEQLADNNGTLFEKEFEIALNKQKFESVKDLHSIGITKKLFRSMVYDIENISMWVDVEQKIRMEYGDTNIWLAQPAGSGHEPDFLIYVDGRMYLLEFKKMTDSNEPIYGDNGCHPFLIYVFKKVSKKIDTCIHTYYYGGDIVPIKRYLKIQNERANSQIEIKKLLSKNKYNYKTPRISVGSPRVPIWGPRVDEDLVGARERKVHDILTGRTSPYGTLMK